MKIFGKEFAGQELVIGALVHTPLLLIWPLYLAAPVCVISAILWTAGGTFWKPLRRYGVPITALIFSGPVGLSLPAPVIGVAWLHVGDGFPDTRPSTLAPGSWLGRQVQRVLPAPEIGGPATKVLAAFIYILTTLLYFL